MNIRDSRLAGKGAIFKEAEKRYGINALYLMAHSALESAWGRSQIAKDKNNFFGIAAYDSSPYTSAKKFDDVDKGILGAAMWIRENYIAYLTHTGERKLPVSWWLSIANLVGKTNQKKSAVTTEKWLSFF